MVWSYDSRTYSDCRPCTELSVLLHVKHYNSVYSVKAKTKANLRRTHKRNYWHRCNHTCTRRLMHDNDVDPINFNHTAVYTHIVIACNGPKIRMCAKSDNTEMTTDLIMIRYDKC